MFVYVLVFLEETITLRLRTFDHFYSQVSQVKLQKSSPSLKVRATYIN